MIDLSFYRGRTVFISGHTGFKGSWMCKVLALHGAKVVGFSLEPPTDPNLFEVAEIRLNKNVKSIRGDVRDADSLRVAMFQHNPDIAIHMAAQPIVRTSYEDPVATYNINVMGTVHFLEAVRQCASVKSVINVTTDKVYQNNEWIWGYRENDRLCGQDPYSNSKSCSELVTDSYKKSFFYNRNIAVTTCRAGNVIGGGDFAKDRIIPDAVRAIVGGKPLVVRNPNSIRPYQHVLEPVCAYLTIAARQYNDLSLQGCYNIGPADEDCVSTGRLADIFCEKWGEGATWVNLSPMNAPHEAQFLKLDCSKIKSVFDFEPQWHVDQAVEKTCEWSKAYCNHEDISGIMEKQIKMYLALQE